MGVPRRRLAWFAAAILAPSCALVFLGLRLLSQEEELERQRRAEATARELEAVRLRLQTALEPFRLNPRPPDGTAFYGRVSGGEVLLAWELVKPAATELPLLMKAADLRRSGLSGEAGGIYARMAQAPVSARDEFGVPLAVYALPNLPAGSRSAALTAFRSSCIAGRHLISATGWRMVRDLLVESKLALTDAERTAFEDANAAERFQRSRESYGELRSGTWSLWGEAPYLVGLTADGEFRAARLDRFRQAEPRLSIKTGLELGGAFAGLRVEIGSVKGYRSGRQEPLLGGIILAAILMTATGGFLFYRDSQREAAMAQMRTQFVANVSHELRTPLTSLRMLTESLHDYPDLPEKTRQEYLQTMMRENERLSRLVENVLEFSRIERGAKRYHLKPVSLEDVVRRGVGSLEVLIRERGFELQVEMEDSLPRIEADGDALEQAVINLLVNAMKYSGAGKFIGVHLCREGSHLALRVSDKGIGIRKEDQEKIFESFYRVPVRENEAIQGAGLGLTLVRHVMQGHGGMVTVRSAPGEGSTFELLLPIRETGV